MAVVSLKTLWLNDAADLTDMQSFPYMASLTVPTSVPGRVTRYANGRLRSVTAAGRSRTVTVSLPACTRAQVAWLEAKAGALLLIRDDRGRKLWGTYFEVEPVEHQYDLEADVDLTLTEVTVDENA